MLGSNIENPCIPHVTFMFSMLRIGKLENSMWFPPQRKVLRSGFLDSLGWKLVETSGNQHEKVINENNEGNHNGTQFLKVNIGETI